LLFTGWLKAALGVKLVIIFDVGMWITQKALSQKDERITWRVIQISTSIYLDVNTESLW
jgi:hypothetical protein